jgi:YbbR domain-containing protein
MNKWLDNITEKSWFMKLVALVLALLLFVSVYDNTKDVSDINVPGEEGTETVTDIPVKAYYDTDNLVVTGVPETVEVALEGPTVRLQPAKTQKDFEVYVDLSDAKVGTQRVKLQIRNLADQIKATINPEYVEVQIQEKVTKQFSIEAEFNKEMVADGYAAGSVVIDPNKIKITGGKDTIEKISYVKAIVDVRDPINETLNTSAAVTVLDENLNKLTDLVLEHESVKVTVPIKRTSKTVPIKILEEGSPPEGVTIESITLDTKEALITGNEDVLANTESVRVEVDVSKINGNTELTLPVIISDGIKEVSPETVKASVKVNIEKEEVVNTETEGHVSFSGLPINFSGLPEGFDVAFVDPSNGKTNVSVTGKNDILQGISADDFQLFLNVAGLSEGNHNVKINVNGPSNVKWTLANETATISITPKEV